MRLLRRGWMTLVVLPAVLVAAGCSTYSAHSPLIRQAMEAQDYEKAIKLTDKISQSSSELLYCYELGTIQHEKGDYAQSNVTFQRAEQVFDELYTKSVSREAGALLVNENISQYRGDAFEAVLVNYYQILNYLFLNQTADALVECRKLNQKLQLLHDAGETYFVDDPFLQYLTALVYERGGEVESAEVSYRRACQLYDSDSTLVCPPSLHCDAAANALRVGDKAQAAEYEKHAQCPPPAAGQGRVLVLVETGAVARKMEASITLPIFNNDRYTNQSAYSYQLAQRAGQQYDPRIVKYWLHVALPVVQEDPPLNTRAVVRATALATTAAEPRTDKPIEVNSVYVEDLDYQANRAYKEKQGTVFLRAIARALAKYLASDAASQQDTALGSLVNLLGAVTERADTRSWTTLPRAIQAARLDLDPGKYKIDVDIVDGRGALLTHQSFDDVEVAADGLEVRRVRLR
jgi:uncharacterized protein